VLADSRPSVGSNAAGLEPGLAPTPRDASETLRLRLGRLGVWMGQLALEPVDQERAIARALESAGYGALWFGEAPTNREAFAHAAILLSATDRIVVATGIANIWVRDATAAANGGATLNEAFASRFVLGLGVSHAPMVNPRGHSYARPIAMMSQYLDALDAHSHHVPAQPYRPPRVLAALGPRMLELARDRAAGAHPYFVTPEHTRRAREILGPDPFLAPEQAFVLETEPARARALARRYMELYLRLPNYLNNLRTLGFLDSDFDDGGSDRLVDAIVAWGDVDAVAARITEHLDAGADHVAVQTCAETTDAAVAELKRLAAAMPAALARRTSPLRELDR
jgi:probable F420-dependent oxidoreductase